MQLRTNSKIRSVSLIPIAAIVLFCCASSLLAQAGLPSGTGDAPGAFGAAGPSELLNGYYTSSLNWVSAIKKAAETLFWALAAIDFTWTCISLVIQHSELQPWMAGFIRKILTIGFFAILLQNGQEWTTAIVNFFINLDLWRVGVLWPSLALQASWAAVLSWQVACCTVPPPQQ